MKPAAVSRYHARMQRVLDHIDTHLDETLSVETLSEVAAFSPFHFQRQFSALFGMGVYRYIQLVRLKRASYRLAFRQNESITEIALDSGYDMPEAFSRAFKQRTGQTPSSFRNEPDWLPWQETFGSINRTRRALMTDTFTDEQVRIIDFAETPIAIMEHRGDPALIGDTLRRFIAWRKKTGLSPRTSATFNLLHTDPETCAPEDFRIGICVATARDLSSAEDGIQTEIIPAGRCAVLRLEGSSDDLRPAATFLYADWLPRSGEELRDFPVFVQRVTFFPEVPENQAITDIFLPLR